MKSYIVIQFPTYLSFFYSFILRIIIILRFHTIWETSKSCYGLTIQYEKKKLATNQNLKFQKNFNHRRKRFSLDEQISTNNKFYILCHLRSVWNRVVKFTWCYVFLRYQCTLITIVKITTFIYFLYKHFLITKLKAQCIVGSSKRCCVTLFSNFPYHNTIISNYFLLHF